MMKHFYSLLVVIGLTAVRQTLLAVTGRVRRPSANDCYLDVSSLTRP